MSGITTAAAITVSNGEYRINAGSWVTTAGTVVNGDQVTVRHTSSSTPYTAVNTVLTIGGVSDTFTSTTGLGYAGVLYKTRIINATIDNAAGLNRTVILLRDE